MKRSSHILFGGDYNSDQWVGQAEIIKQDFALFEEAKINTLTIGVFSWAALEPEEGRYEFDWMDTIFDRAEQQEMRIILATPSGGKPNWMAMKYPDIRRVTPDGQREVQGRRHNHCLTSPVYRQKIQAINGKLAERYGERESLLLWHISNEFSGYCYCDLCFAAFRDWLKAKYDSLEALNDAYWSRFWSHTYTEWEQIQTIDKTVGALVLDWKRFMTDQCRSFIRNELTPIRRITPNIPATTNFMGIHSDYDYHQLAKEIDVASWDAYPHWHMPQQDSLQSHQALFAAFKHDLTRSLKQQPFLLMESSPGPVNWKNLSPALRPGMLRLAAVQALAHGSDSVCYFQMRKGRGSYEQFHAAVIDHVGHGNTRMFREVRSLGHALSQMDAVVDSKSPAKVALVFDWESRWMYDAAATQHNAVKQYEETVLAHYKPFWDLGINVDVVDSKSNWTAYDLVVLPMLFLLSQETAQRLTAYVEAGGTLVTTYGTGIVDASGLAVTGGVPGPLRKALGIWVEESDALPDECRRQVRATTEDCGLSGTYVARHYLDLLHLEGAEALAVYDDDFYAGRPALTRNRFGKGCAWYIASRNEHRFTSDLLAHMVQELKIPRSVPAALPEGVSAQTRECEGQRLLFLMNFNDSAVRCDVGDARYVETESGQEYSGVVELAPYAALVLSIQAKKAKGYID